MPALTAFTQSIKPDSASSSDKKLFNQVVALYDECQEQNEVLQAQVNDCSQYQAQTTITLTASDSLSQARARQIADADSIAGLQRQEIANLNKSIKDQRRLGTKNTIGGVFGGAAAGVALTLLFENLKSIIAAFK